MNSVTRMRALSAAVVICLLVIAALSYTTLRLSNEVEALNSTSTSEAASDLQTSSDPWPRDFDPWSGNWDPTGSFAEIQRRMDEMMNRMLPGNSMFSTQGFGLSPASPKVTMADTEDEYRIVVEIAGGQVLEVKTHLENGVLTVSGVASSRTLNSQGTAFGRALSTARFSQSMILSEPVDETAMEVDQSDDEIVIRVPKLKP